jgi:hypothetical protein
MKAYYLLALLSAAALAGCAYEPVYTSAAPPAYIAGATTYVTPAPTTTYVAPPNTIIVRP